MHFSSVVLPQPDGPTTQTNSFSPISKRDRRRSRASRRRPRRTSCPAVSISSIAPPRSAQRARPRAAVPGQHAALDEHEDQVQHVAEDARAAGSPTTSRGSRTSAATAARRSRSRSCWRPSRRSPSGSAPATGWCRMPAKICGLAAGSTSAAAGRGPRRRTRARVRERRVDAVMPSIVFSSTGHRQTNAMRNTFMSSPTPSTTIANGSSAGGGIERRNSTIGEVARRSVRRAARAGSRPRPRRRTRSRSRGTAAAGSASTSEPTRSNSTVSAKCSRTSVSGGK